LENNQQYDAVVARLLKAGANASTAAVAQHGATPLHFAASLGMCNIMRQLLAAGAQCDALTTDGEPQHTTYAAVHALLKLYSLDGIARCLMLCCLSSNLIDAPCV
jgi:ankyrin repeat protein